MRVRRAALACALGLWACDEAAPAASVAAWPVASAPALPPWPLQDELELRLRIAARLSAAGSLELAEAATDTHILVWREHQGGTETFWLQVDASPSQLAAANDASELDVVAPLPVARLLARREGLWLVGRDGLLQWQTASRRIKTCDLAACSELEPRCIAVLQRSGPFQGVVTEARLLPLASGQARLVGPRVPEAAALAMASPGFAHRLRLLGAMGADVWVRTETETWACGSLVGHTSEVDSQLLVPEGLLLPAFDSSTQKLLTDAHREATRPADADATPREPVSIAVSMMDGQWQAALVLSAVAEAALPGAATPVDHVPLEVPIAVWPEALRAAWRLRPPLGALPPLPPPPRRQRGAQAPLHAGFQLLPAEPTVRARWLALFAAPKD